MRSGRRNRKWKGILTMAALALLLGGMGTAYASWTARLESRMYLNTGVFHMAVSGEKKPEAYLLDAEGEPAESCSVILVSGEGQNEAEFQISSGILTEMLSGGGSMSMEFPLECGADGTVWETGSLEQEEEIRLKPEQILFLSGGTVFALPEHLKAPFEKTLPCLVRTETKVREDGIWAAVTISLADDGMKVVEAWPEVLTMTAAEWEQLVPEPSNGMEMPEDLAREGSGRIGTDTGVVVLYSLKCSLYLDQAAAVETAE